jgi:hypothetical protein
MVEHDIVNTQLEKLLDENCLGQFSGLQFIHYLWRAEPPDFLNIRDCAPAVVLTETRTPSSELPRGKGGKNSQVYRVLVQPRLCETGYCIRRSIKRLKRNLLSYP